MMIQDKLNNAQGRIGVYYENLVTGDSWETLRGTDDDVFESASVIKLWIMSCAYEEAERGRISLDQEITLNEEDMVPCPGVPDYNADRINGCLTEDMFPESGVLNYMHSGLKLNIRDLIHLMILISDNTATNMLIDLLG